MKGTILPNNLEIHTKHREIGSTAPVFVSDLSNRRKRDLTEPTLLGKSRKRLNIFICTAVGARLAALVACLHGDIELPDSPGSSCPLQIANKR